MAKRVAKPKVVKEPKVKKPAAPKKNPIDWEILDSFWNTTKFKTYSNYERGKGYFMLQRKLSINHPIEAAKLSKIGINTGQVVHWWKYYMSAKYNQKPKWTWVSANKKKETAKVYTPKAETVAIYCKLNDCTRHEVEEALLYYPDELKDEMEEIESMYEKT